MVGAIVAIVIVVFLLIAFARTVRIIPQARAGVVERFGRYSRTFTPTRCRASSRSRSPRCETWSAG